MSEKIFKITHGAVLSPEEEGWAAEEDSVRPNTTQRFIKAETAQEAKQLYWEWFSEYYGPELATGLANLEYVKATTKAHAPNSSGTFFRTDEKYFQNQYELQCRKDRINATDPFKRDERILEWEITNRTLQLDGKRDRANLKYGFAPYDQGYLGMIPPHVEEPDLTLTSKRPDLWTEFYPDIDLSCYGVEST